VKIRNGFVSNSSSSSYIIAIFESKPCPHCGRKDPNLLDMIENADHGGDTEVRVTGIEAIIRENVPWQNDPEIRKNREKELRKLMKPYEDKDCVIADIRISYHNDAINTIFRNLVQAGSVIILEDDN